MGRGSARQQANALAGASGPAPSHRDLRGMSGHVRGRSSRAALPAVVVVDECDNRLGQVLDGLLLIAESSGSGASGIYDGIDTGAFTSTNRPSNYLLFFRSSTRTSERWKPPAPGTMTTPV